MTQRRRVRPRCNPGCPGAPAIRRPVPPPGGRHRYPVARPYSLQSLTERKSYLPLQVEHRNHQMFLDGLDGNADARGDLGMAAVVAVPQQIVPPAVGRLVEDRGRLAEGRGGKEVVRHWRTRRWQ